MDTQIILIGGTAGTGKTSVAKELVKKSNIVHHIGTGFIREVARAYLKKDRFPVLHQFTFRSLKKDPVESFKAQCKLLRLAITRVINRAKKEGTSIVIEGNHLLPKYYKNKALFVVLSLDNKRELFKRLNGATHSKRKVSREDLEAVLKIQKYILTDAKKQRIKVINNKKIKETVGIIQFLMKTQGCDKKESGTER